MWQNLDKSGSLLKVDYSEEDHAMSRQMSAYWVRFAKTGNPGDSDGHEWPHYQSSSDTLLEFGDDGIELQSGFRSKLLDFHDANYLKRIQAGQPGTGKADTP